MQRSPVPLVAVLTLAALVPAVGVLWFMTAAMRNERLATQERLRDLYRTQLGAVQRQLAAFWQERQAALQSVAGDNSPAEQFAKVVRDGLAESVVVYDRAGQVAYPETGQRETPAEENGGWTEARELEFQKQDFPSAAAAYGRLAESTADIQIKARALQAQAACLLKAGQKSAALVCLSQIAGDATLRHAVNLQGALIVPNAQLLMLKLLNDANTAAASDVGPESDRGSRRTEAPTYSARQQTLLRLVQRLNDYSDGQLPASQRRFLMQELKGLAPDEARFPTLAAEELAAEYLERPSARPAESKVQRTALPGVWQVTTSNRGLVALYRESTLKSEVAGLRPSLARSDVQISILSPGEDFTGSKLLPPLDVGEFFPGWRLALSFKGADPLAVASARQARFYLATGFVVVTAIGLVAFLVARYVAAQMRLARLKNELVSTVSHELKTPLASMRALVDTLSARRYRDDAQLHDYLNLIARENQRLSHLIENFLTFSRVERGKQPFHFESVAPESIVFNAAAVLREKFESAGCRFDMEVAPGLPAVRGDAGALTTVLVNLLDNACKYTDGDKRIAARAFANCETVCFEVADNGIGLRHTDTKKIFERFYQVDQSLTKQRGGCGLGLSIVQSIVRAHSGTIEVESELGKGSTFRVRIPTAAQRGETLNAQHSTLKA